MDSQKINARTQRKLLPALLAVALCSMGRIADAQSTTVTQYTYDAGDNVATVTDPRGLATSYTHDGLGQLWQQSSPDTGTTSYAYDSDGRRSSMTRADGTQTTYGYDGLNRIISVSAGGLTQSFTYDSCTNGIGRLCADSDATGATSYSYTPEGWVAGRGFSIGTTTYALGYGHDSVGHITTVNYPDGNQANYTYANGVVASVALTVGGTVVNGATSVTYEPMNRGMASWTSSNGLLNSMSYDTDGRLTGISATGVESLGLTYDTADRITQVANGINGNLTQDFGYDAMSRLVSVYSGAENESYQYDANGNRTTQTVNGASTIVTPSATSNEIASTSGASSLQYGYDAKGNTTTLNGTATYSYDAFNRLNSAGGMSYYVNPEGQRLRKTGSIGTTWFAPDQGGSLLAENAAGSWIDYVWLNGRLIGRIGGGTVDAVHADQVGRPEEMTNAAQTVVWRAQDYPFTQQVTVASVTLNLGFPGQYYDAETGNWNNGFRDYSSGLGRYIESDPLGLGGGINTYAYVGGNPLGNVDVRGLQESIAGERAGIDYSVSGWSANPSAATPYDPNQFRNGLAGVGTLGGFAIGAVVVANVAGFPEVEVGEVAVGAIGLEGIETLEMMDAIAGEPFASLAIGGIAGAPAGFLVGGGLGTSIDWLTGKVKKVNCP